MSTDFCCSVQTVALADDPTVVEAFEKVAAVEGRRRLEFSKIAVSGLRLEGLAVEPEVGLGINYTAWKSPRIISGLLPAQG